MKFLYRSSLLLILCVFFISTHSLHAQYTKKALEYRQTRYGIKVMGGIIALKPEVVHLGKGDDVVIHTIKLDHTQPQSSFGIFGFKKFGWLYGDVSAMYSRYGLVFDVTSYSEESTPTRLLSEQFGYLDLQVMGGLIMNNFRIAVGPMMHILGYHNSNLNTLQNYVQKLRNISYGFSGSIGYEIDRYCLEIKYDKAFRTIGDHIYSGTRKSHFLETPDALSLLLTVTLFKP
ncbi:MAG: hypothetical protein H6567_03905 [Lewinellaceae bacterium]|nr:hypothetical protein [Lewinellaceae bacterium]